MEKLSIDIETYSDVDLAKAGVYRYVESPAFEILLFGVSVDGGPVHVYDLACGETLPDEIIDAFVTIPYSSGRTTRASSASVSLAGCAKRIPQRSVTTRRSAMPSGII